MTFMLEKRGMSWHKADAFDLDLELSDKFCSSKGMPVILYIFDVFPNKNKTFLSM